MLLVNYARQWPKFFLVVSIISLIGSVVAADQLIQPWIDQPSLSRLVMVGCLLVWAVFWASWVKVSHERDLKQDKEQEQEARQVALDRLALKTFRAAISLRVGQTKTVDATGFSDDDLWWIDQQLRQNAMFSDQLYEVKWDEDRVLKVSRLR
jgi:hypothetical protein